MPPPHDDRWNAGFQALLKYRDNNGGSLKVRSNENWEEYGGINLYSWINNQRGSYKNKLTNGPKPWLSDEREEKLKSIGFELRPKTRTEKYTPRRDWEEYFAALIEHRDKNSGSLKVPKKSNWDDFRGLNLYNWIGNQRMSYQNGLEGKKNALSKERYDKLKLIGFDFEPTVRTDPSKSISTQFFSWDDNYRLLAELQRQGQTQEQIEASHPRLDRWIQEQKILHDISRRGIRTTLTSDRVAKLRDLGFDFDSPPNSNESAASSSRPTPAQQQSHETAVGGEANARHPNISEEQQASASRGVNRIEPRLVDESKTEDEDDFRRMEQSFMEALDHDILAAEERDMMEKLDLDIQKAEEYHRWLQDNICVEHESDEVYEHCHWQPIDQPANIQLQQQQRASAAGGLVADSTSELVCAVLSLPKYFAGSSKRFLMDQELQAQILPEFKRVHLHLDLTCFSVFLRDTSHDQELSVDLVTKGHQHTVELFLGHIKSILSAKVISHNHQLLLSDGRQIEVEVDPRERLGAEVQAPQNKNYQGLLLSVKRSDESDQLARALGRQSFSCGVALVKAGGTPCSTKESFRRILAQHQAGGKIAMKLQLSVHKDASISSVHSASARGIPSTDTAEVVSLPHFDSVAQQNKQSCHPDNLGNVQPCTRGTGQSSSRPQHQQEKSSSMNTKKRTLQDDHLHGTRSVDGQGLHVPKKTKKHHQGGEKSQLREYSMDFTSSEPLGFYCESVLEPNGESICKICSVCPNRSQASEDCRIQSGSVVVSAKLQNDDQCHSIHNCNELKALYEDAKSKGLRIELRFINSHVSKLSVARSQSNPDWMGKEWRGKSQVGWAGGYVSQVVTGPKPPSNVPATSFGEKQSDSTVEWVERVSDVCARHRSTEPQQISQTTGKSKGRKRVHLKVNPVTETRMYNLGSPATHFLVPSKGRLAETLLPPPELEEHSPTISKEHELYDSLHQGSFKDTLKLLEDGVAADLSCGTLKKMRFFVKKEIESVAESLQICSFPSTESLKPREQDLKMKDKLLKIYINSSHTFKMSKALKSWVVFNISVTQIDNLQLDSPFLLETFHVEARSFSRGSADTPLLSCKLPDLPHEPFSQHIRYDTAVPPYKLKFNASLKEEEEKKLELILKGVTCDNKKMMVLGTVSVSLADLYNNCRWNGSCWNWEGNLDIQPTSESYIKRGAVAKILVRRHLLDEASKEEKRRKELQICKNLVQWIERFNDEVKRGGGDSVLSANVRANSGSLLHAAIYLENQELVQKLVDLGADPLAKCCSVGSALQLAMNMADVQVERDDTVGASKQTPLKERQEHLQEIVQVLQHAFLPNIDPLWAIPQIYRHSLCRYQDKKYGCLKRGQTCMYVHVEKPWGESLDEVWDKTDKKLPMSPLNFRQLATTTSAPDSSGRHWFTSALVRNLRINNSLNREVVLAEGGNSGKRARNGITWWYPSMEDALEALEKAFVVSLWAKQNCKKSASMRARK